MEVHVGSCGHEWLAFAELMQGRHAVLTRVHGGSWSQGRPGKHGEGEPAIGG